MTTTVTVEAAKDPSISVTVLVGGNRTYVPPGEKTVVYAYLGTVVLVLEQKIGEGRVNKAEDEYRQNAIGGESLPDAPPPETPPNNPRPFTGVGGAAQAAQQGGAPRDGGDQGYGDGNPERGPVNNSDEVAQTAAEGTSQEPDKSA